MHIACYLGSANVRESYCQAKRGQLIPGSKMRNVNLLGHMLNQQRNLKFLMMDVAQYMHDLLVAISAVLAARAGIK